MIFDGIIFYGFKYLDSNDCTKCQNENVKLCYICLNCLNSTDHLSSGDIINSGLFFILTNFELNTKYINEFLILIYLRLVLPK